VEHELTDDVDISRIAVLTIPCDCDDPQCPASIQFHIDLEQNVAYILSVDGDFAELVFTVRDDQLRELHTFLGSKLGIQ